MESRKRAHVEDAEPIVTKKRAVSTEYGSPTRVTRAATEADEPQENNELELFRKEAIFRRMKHYSREHERSQHRIAELERRRDACEAGLSAIQACWAQLIGTIRLLVNPEALPPADIDTKDLFDMSVHVDSESSLELEKALQQRMDATRELVASFVQIGSQTGRALSEDDMYISCQKARTECNALRSEVSVMRARLADVESEKESYHSRLVAAENRLERLSSRTVPKSESYNEPLPKEALKEEPASNGVPSSPAKVEDVQMKDETEVQQASAQEESHPATEEAKPNGIHPTVEDMDDWRDIAYTREKEIRKLEEEIARLKVAQVGYETELKAPSKVILATNPTYAALLFGYQTCKRREQDLDDDLRKARKEAEELSKKLREDHDKGNAQTAKVQQEYQSMLAKRDADLVRLRDQRDQQQAELQERKHKDSERIAALESEVKRLRTRIAASTGDEELVKFLFSDEFILDRTYVDELKARLEKAETEVTALKESLASLSTHHPDVAQHIQSEAEARQRATDLAKELEKYQSIFGDISSASASDLPGQMRAKDDELQKLRLQLQQQTQAETALYTELEKLSAAWEGLDKQVKNKVFDLSAMEEKLQKTLSDRAKLENKFYAAMRDKEAVENERKNLVREREKNGRSVANLMDENGNLKSQMDALRSQQAEGLKLSEEYGPQLGRLTDELKEMELTIKAEQAKAHAAKEAYKEALDKHFEQQANLRRREEAIKRKEKEVERMQTEVDRKLRRASESGKGKEREREEELQGEVDSLMSILKCSTCKQSMRNTVITKCMHSFCKQCVEARISTRQRKCPACNLPFGQGDVQSLYFQ
ncbi:hypothetical protein OE88DRAFT_1732858 [Heliocybe sulcata]|uniref:E3 ubiquitin protein ligase n=1 Tax=Heliocybe sulcata TaxID=5364 RepID=A0A5C3NKM3_9AGAM|nr:hypothetical protein OE88DRAFT_1732858 [Heliocybe sulcata]